MTKGVFRGRPLSAALWP